MKFADIKRFWEARLGGSGNNASSSNMRDPPKLEQSTKFSKRKKSKASPKVHRVKRSELFSSSDEAMNACSDAHHGGRPISVTNRQDHRTDVTSANSTIRNNFGSDCESDEDALRDESHSGGHHASNSFAFSFFNRIKKGGRNVARQHATAASDSLNERQKLRSNSGSQRNRSAAVRVVESESRKSKSKLEAREDTAGFWSLKKKKRSYRTVEAPICTKPEARNDNLSRTNVESKTARFGIDRTRDTNQTTVVPISLQRGKSLAERSKTKIRARSAGGKQSPASAPSSLRSSPSHGQRKTEELEKLWRRLPDMNEKFNQIQNFWQMKEKRSVAQFAKERRCVTCGCFLTRPFYEKNDMLYCEDDYWNIFGQECKKCACIITGPIMIAGSLKFHPDCFLCTKCSRFISDGDLYSLVLHNNSSKATVYCGNCFKDVQDCTDEIIPSDTDTFSVIMVINFDPILNNEPVELKVKEQVIPPSVKHGTHSKMELEPIGQIVSDLSNIHQCYVMVGDRILQVNGLNVRNNAEDLIHRMTDANSTAPLQLTVERKLKLKKSSVLLLHDLEDEDMLTMRFTEQDDVICSQPQSYEFKSPEEDTPAVGLIADENVDYEDKNISSNVQPVHDSNSSPLTCSILPPLMYSIGTNCCQSSTMSETNLPDHKNSLNGTIDVHTATNVKSESSVGRVPETSPLETALEVLPPSIENAPMLIPKLDYESGLSEIVTTDSATQDVDVGVGEVLAEENVTDIVPEKEISEHVATSAKSASEISCTSSNTTDNTTLLLEDDCVVDSDSEHFDDQPVTPVRRKRRHGYRRSQGRDAKDLVPPEILDVISKGNIPTGEEIQYPILPVVKEKTNKPLTGIIMNRSLCHPKRSHSLKTSTDGSTVFTRQSSPGFLKPVKRESKGNISRSNETIPSSASYSVLSHSSPARDLNRSESMRIHGGVLEYCHRVFRPCDLIHGEVLGVGFFGKAIKVTHSDTGEVMVLKVLNELDDDVEKAYIKEVKVMRNLSHPNVLRFIGVLYKDKRLNVISEYVECGTLRELIGDFENPFPSKRRIEVAADISSGMSYLHDMSIIHRDLNSSNCFVKQNGTVVVADFGLARIMPSQTSSLRRRKRYTVVGTPYWMAPEMLHNSCYDERVDIFSFGIVLCEIIGRVIADPDILPRRSDFGLDIKEFWNKYCEDCPPYYFAIAIVACDVDPDLRPTFKRLESLFQMLSIHQQVPQMRVAPEIEELTRRTYEEHSLPLLDTVVYQKYHLHKGHSKPSGATNTTNSGVTPNDPT